MSQRILVSCLCLVFAMTLLSACGGGARPACTQSEPAVVRIAVARTIGTHIPNHPLVSPGLFTDATLLRFDSSGQASPVLAKSWQTTDLRTWTVTLRDHLTAHNGEPITAERVRESLLAQHSDFDQVWINVQRIDTPTPTTLVFHLARPSNLFLGALSKLGIERDHHALAAGPFRATHETETRHDFEAFPGFWDGPPRPAGVRVDFYPSERAAWAAFLRNEADFLYEVPPAALPFLARDPNIRLYVHDPDFVIVLGFQLKNPVLHDVRVRQAINMAIDRGELVRRLLGEYPQLIEQLPEVNGPFTPRYWAAQNVGRKWRYDPGAARTLLQEATRGRTEPIELTCLTTNEVSLLADISALLEAQLARVRIKLRLVALPARELLARVHNGDYDLYVININARPGGLGAYIFWRGGMPNQVIPTDYTSANAALDALNTAATPDAERAAVRDVMETMYRDPPAAFLMPYPVVRAVRTTWRLPDDPRDIRLLLPRWTLANRASCGGS
jgi:ABC-type transport system substrate-binding protein